MENKNIPAFPAHFEYSAKWGGEAIEEPGISKREYFAAKAMQGLMAVNKKGEFDTQNDCMLEAARLAVMAADALLAELSKY